MVLFPKAFWTKSLFADFHWSCNFVILVSSLDHLIFLLLALIILGAWSHASCVLLPYWCIHECHTNWCNCCCLQCNKSSYCWSSCEFFCLYAILILIFSCAACICSTYDIVLAWWFSLYKLLITLKHNDAEVEEPMLVGVRTYLGSYLRGFNVCYGPIGGPCLGFMNLQNT